jgi:hypothetical protein
VGNRQLPAGEFFASEPAPEEKEKEYPQGEYALSIIPVLNQPWKTEVLERFVKLTFGQRCISRI